MSKYLCSMCAADFQKKYLADLHQTMWPDHIIVKKKWKGRFKDFLLDFPWMRYLKFVGIFIVLEVLTCHFGTHFNLMESCLLGIGLGLAVD